MNKGSIIERDGKRYKILQDGVKYVAKNKNLCFYRDGSNKGISKDEAIKEGVISLVNDSDLFMNNQLPNSVNIEKKSDIFDPCSLEYTDLPKTYSGSDNIYYMPVDQIRARVFLAHGLIYPAIYDKVSLSVDFHDSQTETPSRLRLYTTPQPLHHNQLLLRILLKQQEIDNADINGEILYLNIPLPISRLTGIEVLPVTSGLDHYISGWINPDVPVPRHLFIDAKIPSSPSQENPNCEPLSGDAHHFSNAESITRFDRYLGVLAFLRNVDRYFSEKTGYYADYPDIFFSVCERIMEKPNLAPADCATPDPLLLALLDFDMPTMLQTTKSLLELVKSQAPYIPIEKNNEAYKLAQEIINQQSENQEILRQAFNELRRKDYRSAILKLQQPEMPVEAAVLAGLVHFSQHLDGYRKVKKLLHEDWSNRDQVCIVLAALGGYYGYTRLDALEYKLYSVHPLIDPLLRDEHDRYPEIKFHLRTRFERELIEAIYQRAFFPNEPIQDSSHLFGIVITSPEHIPDTELSGSPIRMTTYTVQDLIVRQYQITSSEDSVQAPAQDPVIPQHEIAPLEEFIQQLKVWKRDTIDDQSEIGIWLMGRVYRCAEKLQFNFEKEKPNSDIRYSITKDKFIELIRCGTIIFEQEDLKFLEVKIKKDNTQ